MKSKTKAVKTRKSHSVATEKKAQLSLSSELKEYINSLLNEFPFRMFEVKQGNIYLLIDHHKYIDYKREAKRVRLAPCESKSGYYYVTEKYGN